MSFCQWLEREEDTSVENASFINLVAKPKKNYLVLFEQEQTATLLE